MRRILAILCLAFAWPVWGQDLFDLNQLQQEMEKDMREALKRVEKMLYRGGLGGLGRPSLGNSSDSLEYFWREEGDSQVLVIKLKEAPKVPLDIRIEGGGVSISGKGEKRNQYGGSVVSRAYNFHFGPIPIPEGVDSANPAFEKTEKEILVKFPRLPKGGKKLPKKKPILPLKDDLTI